MVIGDKLKVLRAQKNLSQGDIEKRTRLLLFDMASKMANRA
jgi:hypothetical protein